MARRQPSTIKTQRVTKRDTRQETKNKTNAEKKTPQKFNTGINLEAVFGAITQLLETFTSQVLDRNSVNMSLLLRTVYRNLNDDMVDILMEPQNVEYLNKQLEKKNQEVAQALAGGQTTTEKQEQATSEHLTTTVTNVEKVTDTVIQKAPEVNVKPPEVVVKPVEVTKTEKLPDVVEKEQVTERTETLPEEVTETKTETTEVRTVESTLKNVSPSQKAFASGEITSDEDVDILELAQDFINELEADAWKIQQTTGAMAQGLTDQYDEFTNKINEDDEDEYEWNLYRFMFRKQQELNEARKSRLADIVAKKGKVLAMPEKPKEVEKEASVEENKGGIPVNEPVIQPEKEVTPEVIPPKSNEEEGAFTEDELETEAKEGGLVSTLLSPFKERRQQKLVEKELLKAAVSQKSNVILAPAPIRKNLISRLKNGKQLLKLWGKRQVSLTTTTESGKPARNFWESLLKRRRKPKQQIKARATTPQPTMIDRGIQRVANTVNTVRNIFFKPKVTHVAVMNNAIIHPLWIKKQKDKSKRLGLMGRMKRALFGDPAIKWKPLALGWRRYAKAQDKELKETVKSRNAWMRMGTKWKNLYFKLVKRWQKPPKQPAQVSAMVDKATKALNPEAAKPPTTPPRQPTLEELYPREYVKRRLAELDGRPYEPDAPKPPPPPPRENAFTRTAKGILGKAKSLFAPKAPKPAEPAKGVAPVVQKAAEAKGPSLKVPPLTSTQPKPPTTGVPPINPTLNTPKPQAQPKEQGEAAKGLVSIPGKLIDKAKSLRAQQQEGQKQAGDAPTMMDPSKPKGIGALATRAAMGDDEAFRRNVSEESVKVTEALGDKSMSKMSLPHKGIANALKRFFGNTTSIAKKANKDLDDVEDAVNNPRKGLMATVKSFLVKVVIGGLLAIGVLAWFRTNVTSWLPVGADGKMFHGPTIFGITLPRFGEILLTIRSIFYMVWSPLKRIVKFVKRGITQFMKSNEIKGARGFVKYIKSFAWGFLAGKLLSGLDAGMGSIGSIAGGAGKAAGFLPKILGFLKGPLLKVADIVPIMGTIKMATRIAAMVGGALWCLIGDMFGRGNGAPDEMVDDVAKYGEAKVKELVGENRHGTAAANVLIHKAKEIKPLVPLKNILPDSMLAKNEAGRVSVKALVPNMPQINLAKGTVLDEEKDINQVAKKRRQTGMKEAGDTGLKQINRAMEGQPEPPWEPRYGEPSPQKLATLKFIAYAQKNADVLAEARKNIKGKFDGHWSSDCWWFNDGKDSKIVWNPEWQYTGKNREMLMSVMPPEPFGDSTKGKKYEIAEPWNHEIMGILPLGVRIPSTNAAWMVDAKMWERDRLDIGVSAWAGAARLARNALESNNEDEMVGGKNFTKNLLTGGMWSNGGDDWVRISTRPNYTSRIRNSRKNEMIAKWNRWNEMHGKTKEKVDEIREGLQPVKKPEKEKKEKPIDNTKPQAAKEGSSWSRFWAGPSGKIIKDAALYGNSIGLMVLGGKKVWSFFKRKKAEKEAPKPPPPPPPYGLLYLAKEIKKEPWKTLNAKNAKDEDLRKLFKVDDWFNQVPPSDEKIYKSGIGKMFYNILLAMGFKYDKQVWQNPQFLKVRLKSMQAMVDSINAYVSNIIRPHGAYMISLLEWAKTHKSVEEQEAVKAAGKKESRDIWKSITKDKFMEYVARYYIPTDIHLVVRDKTGKIIKEEGKELRGLSIPKELYDQDPAYWDYVMSLMNNSAIPPEKLIELQRTRIELISTIQESGKRVGEYMKVLKRKSIRLNLANILADKMLALRMKMLTKSAASIHFRVNLAKQEIKLYFKYRKFLETGSLGAFRSFIMGGNKLSKKEQFMLFGKQIEGGTKSLSQRMLGSISEVIADRRKLIKRMRAIIRSVLNHGDKAIQKQSRFNFGFLKTVVKKAGSTIAKVAKGATKIAKNLILSKVNLGIKTAQAIKKATKINLKLFGLFNKKKADDADVKVQVDAAAKEMIPEGDTEGKERLERIVRIANERKTEAEKEKSGLMNYWADLRRQWKDRISEESMHELQSASLKLSDNILDYLGMVREIPAGQTMLVKQEIHQLPSVIDLLPDITFC